MGLQDSGDLSPGCWGRFRKTPRRGREPWGGAGRERLGNLGAAPARPPTEDRAFSVRIAGAPPLQGVLGGTLTIPCHVHYSRPPSSRRAVLGSPRVKWTFLSGGREAEVLVARGLRVKVSEAYRFRVALPAYPASLTDVSLALGELRPNDSGIYRCEVQHGIDDSSDAVEVKVKGERTGQREVPPTPGEGRTQAPGNPQSEGQQTPW